MMTFFHIFTIAKFETKMLLRSWFFRIFAIIAIVIIGLFDLVIYTNIGFSPWSLKAIASTVPYANLMLLNIAQAIIAAFLASDFLRRDTKLDTTDVFYTRPVSNGEYIFGKTAGLLFVFIILNLIILLVGLIFNLVNQDIPVMMSAYIYYPLLISLPTLVFIFGLAFLLMTIIRNQAVTFILLIGYVVATLFYFGRKLNFLLDYMAFRVPMTHSDFIGFGNLNEILIHRGIYFVLGIGLIAFTVAFLKRLPQSKPLRYIAPLTGSVCFIIGIWAAIHYIQKMNKEETLRQDIIRINEKHSDAAIVDIEHYDINIRHRGNTIHTTAEMQIINNSQNNIEQVVFRLNPGLKISEISINDENISYSREKHMVIISPDEPLPSKTKHDLKVVYKGYIDERACYVDIDTSKRQEQYRFFVFNIDKRYSFIRDDFVLLTREANWYPLPGTGYFPGKKFDMHHGFSTFHTKIYTKDNLLAFSQGRQIQSKDSVFEYTTDYPVPQISLVIGPYTNRSIAVDSIDYSLITKTGHTYFTKYLTEIQDTLTPVIRELKNDYERQLNLMYPFRRFTVLEVPVQFASYQRIWTFARENAQPEIVLLPENCFMMFGADFLIMTRRNERRQKNDNETRTDKEIQVDMFKQAFENSLAASTTFAFAEERSGETANPYSIFPNYYTYAYYVDAKQIPVINLAVESYFNSNVKAQLNDFWKRFGGLSAEEIANVNLKDHSLDYYVENEQDDNKLLNMIHVKGEYLFSMFEHNTGKEQFLKIFSDYLYKRKFTTTQFRHFVDTLNSYSSSNLQNEVESWYTSNVLPEYIIKFSDNYKVRKGDRELYQVKLLVNNQGRTDGYIHVNFQTGERRRRFGGPMASGYGSDSEDSYLYHIPSGKTKEIGILLYEKPNRMNVNTLISGNIPSTISFPTDEFDELKPDVKPFEGDTILNRNLTLHGKEEYVVDNEDDGFEIVQPETGKILRNLIDLTPKTQNQTKYKSFNHDAPREWTAYTASELYGDFIRSAWFVRAGEGKKKAIWKTLLPERGSYEVYSYLRPNFFRGGRRRRRNDDERKIKGTYEYIIVSDDGKENIEFNLEELEEGWNYLGSFYYADDTAKVILTDKAGEDVIIHADAIKWIKK